MDPEGPLYHPGWQVTPPQALMLLKANILVATSLIEAIGRVATNDSIMARVRPQSYYHPSKRTYSHLFSEIQEAVDITLVKFQRAIFAENLQGPIVVCR
jgi:hypothetical protein